MAPETDFATQNYPEASKYEIWGNSKIDQFRWVGPLSGQNRDFEGSSKLT